MRGEWKKTRNVKRTHQKIGNKVGDSDKTEATDKRVLKRRERLEVRFYGEIRKDKVFKYLLGLGKYKSLRILAITVTVGV